MAKSLPTPEQVIERYIRVNEYQGIGPDLMRRYTRMLALRAARFYLDSSFDAHTVDEDLADCSRDTGFYESGHVLRKTDLANLADSEKHELDYYKGLRK